MLDGILGRGFSVKCKSVIKATGERLAVLRRRVEAKQRFLNEDLAKLLSNGLDINAYGRTEEYLAGMNLLSCYDFVEQSCEFIIKQLSRMQKQGECPEECREVVASLMYAAARFSDFPELRDLRDIFQQKYGSCLEVFVNQKFVEKLSSSPPQRERRLQVLQVIASEFSIKWDSKGFERRMAASSVIPQVDEQKVDRLKLRPGLLEDKSRIKNCGEGEVWKRDEGVSRRKERVDYIEKSGLKNIGSSSQDDVGNFNNGRHRTENRNIYPLEKCDAGLEAERSNDSSHEKIPDNNAHNRYLRNSNGICTPRKGEGIEALFREKNFGPSCEQLGKTDNAVGSMRKVVDEESHRLRTCPSSSLPPPYIKSNHSVPRPPYVKKEDKQKISLGSKDSLSGRPPTESDNPESEDLDYQDELISLPKPRSIRRKHHKSSSSNNVDSRRKDHSRKGLQVLFDEEHYRKDDEERMIDKLLIHYSKKPTSYDAGKLRKKLMHDGESSFDQSINVHEEKFEAFPAAARSVSLPREQASSSSPEVKKVLARSKTLQADNQAKHVHPKLPDYDDIAARFAALKGR